MSRKKARPSLRLPTKAQVLLWLARAKRRAVAAQQFDYAADLRGVEFRLQQTKSGPWGLIISYVPTGATEPHSGRSTLPPEQEPTHTREGKEP